MNWFFLIGAMLELVLTLAKYVREKQLLDAGEDRAIANMTLAVLEATQVGKELREKVAAMSDPEADALWKSMVEGRDA